MGEYFATQLPSRFGNFDEEYRAMRETGALLDANYRALFSFTGADRHRYLNAILTSNVRDQKPGQGTTGLLLTPQGHILAEIETYAQEDRILSLSHAMVRERTAATLEKFIIMDDVTLEDLTGSNGTLDLAGPRAWAILEASCGVNLADAPLFSHTEATMGPIPIRLIRREIAGVAAATLIVAREHLVELWTALSALVRAHGGVPAGMEPLNSARLEAGTPWFGVDYDDKQIPHEVGLELSHISYEKGCYTGQEIVERVRSRGHVNRRLAELRFLGDAAPAPETKLISEGSEFGVVTSTGFSPILGQPIGLGYLRREKSAIGTGLDASGIRAEVIAPPASPVKSPA